MEAKIRCSFWPALAVCLCLFKPASGLPASAQAVTQDPQTALLQWTNESLNLQFRYPADLIRRNPVEAWTDEHLMIYGVPGSQIRRMAVTTSCLKPLLSVELPTSGGLATKVEKKNADGSTTVTVRPALLGTILLAELDIDCLKPELQPKNFDPLTEVLSLLPKVPGMHAVLPPTMYLQGRHKIYTAGAQGLPKFALDPDFPIDPLLTYTMGFSTAWDGHYLVWYLSANNANTLNRMTKSLVKFGEEPAVALYPLSVHYDPGR